MQRYSPFSSLFIGISFAIREAMSKEGEVSSPFSSLFIGISFAIRQKKRVMVWRLVNFQFPFHRDQLCDSRLIKFMKELAKVFQFPFHRDQLCDSNWKLWYLR